jgi:phosphatidylglycerol lysyltransferase
LVRDPIIRIVEKPREEDRSHVLALLRHSGWNITSFQVLEPGLAYCFVADVGCVAFMDTGRAWVVAGAPIAAEADLAEVTTLFLRRADEQRRRVAFFATELRFLKATRGLGVLIGEQPIFDPRDWGATVAGTRSLREQLRRARSKQVKVRRLEPAEIADETAPMRVAIQALIDRWMGTRPMPPMGFLVRVHPFSFCHERRLFVASEDGAVVGFAAVVPVYARQGWFIEDLVRAPHAPNGTTELLVDAAMRDAAALGSRYVTLGLAPLAGAVDFWFRSARKYGSALYDFAGLRAFKAKFRPKEWAPIYLAHLEGQHSSVALYDSLVAFAKGGLLRYGAETLLRGPRVVVELLAFALLPWTLLLAQLDGARWFPAPWMKWFWVVFDLALAGALYSLAMRWRPRLARVVVGLVLGDALVTLWQAVTFDVVRVRSPLEAALLFVGVYAPLFASIVLSNAERRAIRAEPSRT